MNRLKMTLALLLAALLTLAGLAVAAPAQAADAGNCSAESFCLYQWTDYKAQVTGDRWQTSFDNMLAHPNGCINLAGAVWDNGSPVADNTASMQWNSNATYRDYVITFYNWTNCNGAGAWGQTPFLTGPAGWTDLHFGYPSSPSISVYHTITSVQITYKNNG